MKMQNDADTIIKAYGVCKSQLTVLEKEHGYKFAAKNPHASVWDESRFSFA